MTTTITIEPKVMTRSEVIEFMKEFREDVSFFGVSLGGSGDAILITPMPPDDEQTSGFHA